MEKRKIFNPITIAKEEVELSSRDKLDELVENHKLTFDDFMCDTIGDLYILHLDWNNKYYFDRKLVEDYFGIKAEEKDIVTEDDFEESKTAIIICHDKNSLLSFIRDNSWNINSFHFVEKNSTYYAVDTNNEKMYFARNIVEDLFGVGVQPCNFTNRVMPKAPNIRYEEDDKDYYVNFKITITDDKSAFNIYKVEFTDKGQDLDRFMKKIAKAISGYSGD